MITMICITIIAIALAGYFARRAKLMEKRKIRASLKSAETEIALRRSLKNLGTAYEKIKAHSVARCGKCGRLYTWKQVADLGNYYVCENCEAKRSRSIVEPNSKNEIKLRRDR
jgi:predicted RNA-binding Zn-ribbon protein involved in translation (DUF1610 family)